MPPQSATPRHGEAVILGLTVGIVGSVLDFYSGYQIVHSGMTLPGMGITQAQYDPTSLVWGIGVMALGAAVLVTALIGPTPFGRHRMKTFGSLMASYGIFMLFLGVSMYAGVAPMMQEGSLAGAAMLIVGALMVLSGGLMVLPRAGM